VGYRDTLFDLSNRVAVVTGGSRGIGRAIALGLAEAGADVVATSRNIESVKKVTEEIRDRGRRSFAISTDVSRKEDRENLIARTINELGKIDILVNNAGISPFYKKAELTTEEDWDRVISVNLSAPFFCCLEVGKHMIEEKYGKIINVASILGQVGFSRQIVYVTTKAGLIAITKTLALEWCQYNINVNALAPGFVETDLTTDVRGSSYISERILRRTAMGRYGKPEEVVGAAIYLASGASSYVNGAVINVDGAYLAG